MAQLCPTCLQDYGTPKDQLEPCVKARVCKTCKVVFRLPRRNRKFCSEKCRRNQKPKEAV